MLIFGFTTSYQSTMPCDDDCFRSKIEESVQESTSENYVIKHGENDWRYDKYDRH